MSRLYKTSLKTQSKESTVSVGLVSGNFLNRVFLNFLHDLAYFRSFFLENKFLNKKEKKLILFLSHNLLDTCYNIKSIQLG